MSKSAGRLVGRVQTLFGRMVERPVDGRMSNEQLTAEIERLALNRSNQRAARYPSASIESSSSTAHSVHQTLFARRGLDSI